MTRASIVLTAVLLAGATLVFAVPTASACSGPTPIVGDQANCMVRNGADRHLNTCPGVVGQAGCAVQDALDAVAYAFCYVNTAPINWVATCA
jgi:hypothetical protein